MSNEDLIAIRERLSKFRYSSPPSLAMSIAEDAKALLAEVDSLNEQLHEAETCYSCGETIGGCCHFCM